MHKLVFSLEGRASLSSLDKGIAQRVLDKLKWLIQNIGSITPIPLRGDLSGLYKLRVGDWRVIYEVNYDERIIVVHKFGHRKEVYK